MKESFLIAHPEEEERTLLGVGPCGQAMFVSSEHRDGEGRPEPVPILLRRQV